MVYKGGNARNFLIEISAFQQRLNRFAIYYAAEGARFELAVEFDSTEV
jgi:hypothetical protein